MELFWHYARCFKWRLVLITLLSFLNAAASLAIIHFINRYIIVANNFSLQVLCLFLLALVSFLVVQTLAQIALSSLGHKIVHLFRMQLTKQIIDSDYQLLKSQGKGKLLASLNNDLDQFARIFINLPDLIQGIVLATVCMIYLGSLSGSLLLVTIVWFSLTLYGMYHMVRIVMRGVRKARDLKDQVSTDYQALLDGHRELKLNLQRAQMFHQEKIAPHSDAYRKTFVEIDFFHYLRNNFTETMVLASVGILFYLAYSFNLARAEVTMTYAVTLLFYRKFIFQAVFAIPDLGYGVIAIRKVKELTLAPYQESFTPATGKFKDWQEISFVDVCYQYPHDKSNFNSNSTAEISDKINPKPRNTTSINNTSENSTHPLSEHDYPNYNQSKFALEKINFNLLRGETVFLIGKNGSGKSTLSQLLTGLTQATGGKIFIDKQELTADLYPAFHEIISTVFSDFYLFKEIPNADTPETQEILEQWIKLLQMESKVAIIERQLSTVNLSTGQRKRLALLTAIAEQRSLLVLDEWAADQDPAFRYVFYREILPRLKAKGMTIFAISHDDAYFDVADRVLLINQGKLRELNTQERATQAHFMVESQD